LRFRWQPIKEGRATPMDNRTNSRGYIYVASSWRNQHQPAVVDALRQHGFGVYDFKNPPGATGFTWEQVGLDHTNPVHGDPAAPDLADTAEFLAALDHPRSQAGFDSDFSAMQRADAIVAVAPCGKSAHLELGWGVGAGKHTAVLLDDPCTPELMLLMTDYRARTLPDLLRWLDQVLPAHEAPQGLVDACGPDRTAEGPLSRPGSTMSRGRAC
jgi:hypothetical protein